MPSRDKDGLTEKQRQSVPIIAVAKSVRSGILECLKLGIVSSTSYFYTYWNKEPAYHAFMLAERTLVQGEMKTAILDRFRHQAEDHAENINRLASEAEKESVQLAASKAALTAIGIDTGGGSHVNVSATASAQVSEKQDGFRDLLAEQLQKRLELLQRG